MSASFDLDALERLAAERLDVENDCDLGDGGVPCQQCVDEREMAVGVAALVRAVKAAQGCMQEGIDEEGQRWYCVDPRGQKELRAALAPFAPETGEAA